MISLSQIPRRLKLPMFLMILTILMSFLVPSVLAQPSDTSRKFEVSAGSDLAFGIDTYCALMNYNEPSNPYVILNYYYENGSQIRMIFGVDPDVFPSLNLNSQNNVIQVFDKKGKLDGYGIGFKPKSKVFVYVPA